MLRADNGNWLAHRLFPHGGSMRQGKRITAAPQCISENGESGSAALWYNCRAVAGLVLSAARTPPILSHCPWQTSCLILFILNAAFLLEQFCYLFDSWRILPVRLAGFVMIIPGLHSQKHAA